MSTATRTSRCSSLSAAMAANTSRVATIVAGDADSGAIARGSSGSRGAVCGRRGAQLGAHGPMLSPPAGRVGALAPLARVVALADVPRDAILERLELLVQLV